MTEQTEHDQLTEELVGEVIAEEIERLEEKPVSEKEPLVVKTFQMAGNRNGEILDFVISELEDDVGFSLGGHDLPFWFADVIWGLMLGFKDPVWIRLLVYWARCRDIMSSSYLGNHDMVEDIMEYMRDRYSVEDAVKPS